MPKIKLKDAYAAAMDRIGTAAEKSGRSASDVLTVAVSKYTDMAQVRELIELGHADFGENQGQQLSQRATQAGEFLQRKRQLGGITGDESDEAEGGTTPGGGGGLPDRVRWHMVGHLQRNKVKQVAPVVDLIHSVDSLRLAEELHGFGAKKDIVIDVLLQVNIAGEESKHGIAPPAVRHLVDQMDLMMHLRLRGLMTMAPHVDDPEETRTVFRRCRELFEEAKAQDSSPDAFNILSMGMSNDYEVAVEEGSNCIRLGRTLFGDPPPES